MVNLIHLYDISKDKKRLLLKLQEWGLIPKDGDYKCPKCGNPLKVGECEQDTDGFRWCCNAKINKHKKTEFCYTRVRFRQGTFFARSHLSIYQILAFSHLWSRGVALKHIMHEVEISIHTAVDWSSFCREIVLNYYLDYPVKIGGPGLVVEVDESKFGKRKFHRGHPVDGAWVFGGVERQSGRVFMEIVEKRDNATLMTLIRKYIQPGSIIHSDCWKAYANMDKEFHHFTVNHKLFFKDPETGVHTNTIESIWRHAKESMSSHNRKKEHIPGNLARFVFMKSVRAKKGDYGEEFFKMAGELYNPTKVTVEKEAEEVDDEDIELFD